MAGVSKQDRVSGTAHRLLPTAYMRRVHTLSSHTRAQAQGHRLSTRRAICLHGALPPWRAQQGPRSHGCHTMSLRHRLQAACAPSEAVKHACIVSCVHAMFVIALFCKRRSQHPGLALSVQLRVAPL